MSCKYYEVFGKEIVYWELSNRRCFQISSILLTYVITSIFVTMSIYCCFAENQQIGKSFGLGRWTFCVSAIFADEQILVTCSFLVFS